MHLLEVAIGGLLQVVFVKEEISVLGAVGLRLQEIDGLQPEALGHLQDRFMAGGGVHTPPPPAFLLCPPRRLRGRPPPPPRARVKKNRVVTCAPHLHLPRPPPS